jgi:hypothetical protein
MKFLRLCLFALVLAWTCAGLLAIQPRQWIISTPDDFLEGDLKGVSVTGEGGLTQAPALEEVFDTKEAFVYAAVMDASGNVFLGTGNQGKIFRVGATGEGSEWAKLQEPQINALALDSTGRLYAATSPDGKVYRFAGGPTPETFFDPGDKYIWSLAIDAQNNLYVGTGPRGIIYKVDPQGESEVFYDSKETHIVALKLTPDGQLLAGTAPGGLIFRFTADGKPFVLYDSGLTEVKALATDRYGNIYAAALSGGATASAESETLTSEPGAAATGAKKTPVVATTKDEDDSEAIVVQVGGEPKGKKTEVYKIDKTDLAQTIYSSDDGLTYDMLVRQDGSVLLATSNKGRIISIDPRGFVTYLVQTTEEQVTQLIERAGRLYAATSNLGKLLLIGAKAATGATYESEVFDAGVTANWGMIRWRSPSGDATGIKVYTRSGNTSTADQTWSPWDGPYAGEGAAAVTSAPARFLQTKLEFPERPAGLTSSQAGAINLVTISYQQRNMPPRISELTVYPPAVAFADFPTSSPAGGMSPGGPDQSHLLALPRPIRDLDRPAVSVPPRKQFFPGARSLSWTATDPNQDDLVYSVYLRKQGDDSWLLVKEGLTETHCTIDGLSYPAGVYFARVTASDRPSNPADQSLDAELVSKAFVLATAAPTVELGRPQTQGRSVTLEFTCKSLASYIFQAEYCVDGADWQILLPNDGIADSEAELYTLRLENLTPGEHQLLIRVVDSVGTLGAAATKVVVQ